MKKNREKKREIPKYLEISVTKIQSVKTDYMEMVYIDDIRGRVCYNKLPLGLIILTCNLTTLKEETLPYYKVLSETVSFSSNCGLRTG